MGFWDILGGVPVVSPGCIQPVNKGVEQPAKAKALNVLNVSTKELIIEMLEICQPIPKSMGVS